MVMRRWWRRPGKPIALHPDVRRRVLAILLMAGILAWAYALWLAREPAKQDPALHLNASSHAIAFAPAANFDLVRAARPRFGLLSDGSQYNGIGIDTLTAEILLHGHGGPRQPIRLLSSLVITPGCVLRIEHYVGTHIRLTVEQAQEQSCTMRAEFIRPDGAYDEVERAVDATSTASLTFRPLVPLVIRDVAVMRMGFETNESGEWQSAIVRASLQLSDSDDTAVAGTGDGLTLGLLNGRIIELVIGDTLHVTFRGTAARPNVAGIELRPSRLAELASDETIRMAIAIVLGVIGLLAGFFQAILR